jgi:hypothetical protein
VLAWDAALRAGDWDAARAALTDDATYASPAMPEDVRVECASPDEIVELMRSFKGQMPDVEVVEWEPRGDEVIARLRQPEWGDDSDWYQVLTVRDGRVAHLADHPTRESALGGA